MLRWTYETIVNHASVAHRGKFGKVLNPYTLFVSSYIYRYIYIYIVLTLFVSTYIYIYIYKY